jgi:hypothetical protein
MLCEKGEPGEGTDAAAGEAGFIERSKRAHLANTLTAISSIEPIETTWTRE